MPNGASLFVRSSIQSGLDTIFTLVGDHLNEVLAEAAQAGMRVVDLRHESAVAHAADAWARIHRKPALSLVTGGPGHTNSLTGIATAQLAGSPLVAVSGSRASRLANRNSFQDIDQLGTARPLVKWAAEPPSAADIPFYLERACRIANAGRKGAVHLTIPVDRFTEEAGDAPPRSPVEQPSPARPDVTRAIELLRSAERPVAIAGSGVWWSGAEGALRRFIEHTSIPLYTITMARGAVPDDHPLAMGYADPALNRAAHTVLREADVVLVIGKRVDFRLAMGGPRLFSESARLVQIDVHEEEFGLNRRIDCMVHADARMALEAMLDEAGPQPWAPRPSLERARELRKGWQQQLGRFDSDLPMHPAAFFHALREALPAETLFSWDGGDFAHWGRAILPARHAGGWLRLGPLGAIGSALPNALALQMAHPGGPVALITGDGALGFYLAELDSAVRHQLPIVVIVGNDAGWGLERELQSFATGGSPTVACELRAARYDVVMQAFGGGGETVERVEEVVPAVRRAFSAGAPYCINVRIRGVRSPFTEWQIAGKAKQGT